MTFVEKSLQEKQVVMCVLNDILMHKMFIVLVRGALFNINGVIAEKFPEHSTSNADRFGTICLKTLKQQVSTSSASCKL